jgi:hypothetical protein
MAAGWRLESLLATVDHRHFTVFHPAHIDAPDLLPLTCPKPSIANSGPGVKFTDTPSEQACCRSHHLVSARRTQNGEVAR